MATYSSPFETNLQTTIFTEDNLSNNGLVDAVGSPSTLSTIELKNGDGAARYFAAWDGTAATYDKQDLFIRVQASTSITVHIDKGLDFSTAVTLAATTTNNGGVSPTNFDLVMFTTASA